jgi:hypothetical protein
MPDASDTARLLFSQMGAHGFVMLANQIPANPATQTHAQLTLNHALERSATECDSSGGSSLWASPGKTVGAKISGWRTPIVLCAVEPKAEVYFNKVTATREAWSSRYSSPNWLLTMLLPRRLCW